MERPAGRGSGTDSNRRTKTVHRNAFLLTCLAFAAGCGTTEPENVVVVSGTVVAAADGQGFTQGQALDGAQLTLRYTSPLDLSVSVRDQDQTDATGTWELQAGPPAGQSDPDCRQLTVAAVRTNFATGQLRLSSVCGQGAGRFDGLVIELTPNPSNE